MRNLLVFVLHLIFSILFVCVFVSPWFSLASHLSAVSFIAPPFHLVLLHGNLISSNTHTRYANAWCLMMKWRCRTIKKSPSTIVGCFKRIKSNRLVDIRKWGIRFISFDSVPFHSKQSHSRMFYRTIFSLDISFDRIEHFTSIPMLCHLSLILWYCVCLVMHTFWFFHYFAFIHIFFAAHFNDGPRKQFIIIKIWLVRAKYYNIV